jgi:phage head maturation protease
MYVLWWPSFGFSFWTNDQVLVSFFFFWTNDQVLVSLNAHVRTLFNHDISNLLPFCKKNLEHVIIL